MSEKEKMLVTSIWMNGKGQFNDEFNKICLFQDNIESDESEIELNKLCSWIINAYYGYFIFLWSFKLLATILWKLCPRQKSKVNIYKGQKVQK